MEKSIILEKDLMFIERNWMITDLFPKNCLLFFNNKVSLDPVDENAKRQLIIEIMLDLCCTDKYTKEKGTYEVVYVIGTKIYEMNEIINRWKLVNNIENVNNFKIIHKNYFFCQELNSLIFDYLNNKGNSENIKINKNIIFVFDYILLNIDDKKELFNIRKPYFYDKYFEKGFYLNIWINDFLKDDHSSKLMDVIYYFSDKGNRFKLENNTRDIDDYFIEYNDDDIFYIKK